MGRSDGTPGPRLKVVRLIEAYGLEGVGPELEGKWTRQEDRLSLQELADLFNQRLVAAALESADVEPYTADVSHLYGVLSGTTGSSGERTQVTRHLEREGVDVDALTEGFVTYQAIRSYLKKRRDASPPTKDDEEVRRTEARVIERLRRRTERVAETKLERLQNTDRIGIGSSRVLVDMQVLCESCGTRYDVGELLEERTCECYSGDGTPIT